MAEPQDRRLAAVMFCDMVGFTAAMQENEPSALALRDRYRTVVEDQHMVFGGEIVQYYGDGTLSIFSNSVDAVRCAVSIQQTLRAEPVVPVRVGVHVGDVVVEDHGLLGDAVNVASRIESFGQPGAVLVSDSVHDLVKNQPDLEVVSLGVFHLDNVARPHELFAVDADGLMVPGVSSLSGKGRPVGAPVLSNLPVQVTSFVGRVQESAELEKQIRGSRLVTLTGVGGSGKTRLALHTAAEMSGSFPDGVWMIELAPVTDGADIPQRVAESLGLDWRFPQEKADRVRRSAMEAVSEFLQARTALLVLDNCEHVIGAAAELTDRLLQSCLNLRVLTTSREGLGVGGERLIQVPSLGLPSVFDIDDGERDYPDAMALFAERAAAVSRFELNPETAATVADICRRLDGMPLAIELAAARTRMLNVVQISERLTDTFRLLTGGARTALPRQQTLLATMDWSYQLLDETEQTVFDRLAVFRGGFFLEAAEAVVSGDGVDELDVFDAVASLVDRSMIQASAEEGRFGLLETLRQFALQKLTDAGESDRWRERHLDYYANVAEEAHSRTRSRDQVEWFERLDRDHENLKAALEWGIEHDRFETAASIANGLWWFWGARGHVDTALTYVQDLLARNDLPVDLRIGLLTAAAYLEFEGGDIGASLPAGVEAVELARDFDDPATLSLALIYWANTVSHNFGRWDEAHAGYDEGYELGREIGSDWLMGWHALNKGWIHRVQGNREESERLLLIARDHLRLAQVPLGLGWSLSGLGAIRRSVGDNQGALEFLEEARNVHTEYGNRGATSWAMFAIALTLSDQSRHHEALEVANEALGLLREISKNYNWGPVMATIQRRRKDLSAAIDALEQYAAEGDIPFADFMVESGFITAAVGNYAMAAPLLAFGMADLTRDGSKVAPSMQEEWDAAWAEIERHVDDSDAISAQWSVKTIDEMLPTTLEALAEARRTLASTDG
jgi:predicted ATPase/class 3 adenylate cyclase